MYSDPSSSSEQEVVTRTFKIHRFDPHPRRRMLIIRGDLMISVTSPIHKMVLAEDTREFKKVISLEGLSKDSDRETIIDEILKSCPFIDTDLVPHLSITVEYLRNRKYDDKGFAISATGQPSSKSSTPVSDFPDYFEDESMLPSETAETDFHEKVDMASLESYVELLYEEDFSEKVRGARLLSKLAKISENLVSIAYHESALNALFRTLREDYKKSMDLTTYILSVCQNYAQFTDFHKLLTSHKVCTITFDVIEFELLRYEKWTLEVARRQDIVELEPPLSKFRSDFEKMKQKYGELTRKQDALLSVAFDILLHMSENKYLHREILGRGIISMLVSTLERKNLDLLSVVLTFLKNLSLFAQAKQQLNQLKIIENLTELLNASVPKQITDLCLGLLFNLCFDTRMRHKLVKLEMLPKIVSFLSDPILEHNTRKILYLMSMDRRIRPKLCALKIVPVVLRLLSENREKLASNLEVAGIAINLSKNKRAAGVMCEQDGLVHLLQQAFENEDPLVMKIIRNISEHSTTKPGFRDFTCDLARAIGEATSSEFIMECTGTLSNLDLPNVDYCKILNEFGLIPWIQSVLMRALTMASQAGKPPTAAGQTRGQKSRETARALMTLEVIVLIGTCAGDEDASDLLIEEGILELLIKILVTNGTVFVHSQTQQNQLKHQILYVFFRFCCHSESRRYIQEKTRIPKIILEILNDHRHGNGRSQQICEGIMDLFGECDKEWLEKLKDKRFTLHNEAWIDMTERTGGGDDGAFDSILGQGSGSPSNPNDPNNFGFGADDQDEEFEEEDEDDDDDEEDEEEFDEEDDGRSNNGDNTAKSIFDRFRAQYEQEKKAREEWEKDMSEEDEENDDDESVSSPSIDAQWDAAFKGAMITGGGGGGGASGGGGGGASGGGGSGSGRKSAMVKGERKSRPKSEFRH